MRFIPAVSPVQIQVPLPNPWSAAWRFMDPLNGPLVKWLRHGPFTAVTWVRIPYGSPSHKTSWYCGVLWAQKQGGLAQLVRAPASHAGGHWFESSSLHQKIHDFARNHEFFFIFICKEFASKFDFCTDQYTDQYGDSTP